MIRLTVRPIVTAVVGAVLLAVSVAGLPGGAVGAGPAVAQQPSPPPPQERRPVTAIEVRGSRRIPTERILAVITATKTGETLAEDRLREDIRAIVELGVFTDVTVRLEPEDEGVRVVFLVIENPVVAEVIVEGTTAIAAEEIRRTFNVQTGEVLNLVRMREGARAIEKLYETRGYVLARVADLAVVPLDAAENTARLRLRIAEGRVETVQFSGLRRTRQATVRRYIRETVPGKAFNVNELNRDLQRLFDTGLFESIRAQPRVGETPDSAVIVIELQEARTTQVGGGVGYDTVSGVLGFIEYHDRNWRGLAQTVAVRAERGLQTETSRFNFNVSFTEPFLDERRTGVELNLYSRALIDREYAGGVVTSRFEVARSGASATLSRPIDRLTTATLRLKSELTGFTPLPLDSTDPSSPVVPPSLLSSGKVVSFTLSGARDSRDDRLAPKRGDRTTLSLEFASAILGSDFTFAKQILDAQRLFPAGGGAVAVGRLYVGSSTGNLPLQEYFILGGPSTVRALPGGFARDTSIAVANIEYRLPLGTFIRQLGEMQAILFVDAGRAPMQSGPLHVGYGIGVSVKTAVGPLRVDFAFGPQGRQTWLSVGAPF